MVGVWLRYTAISNLALRISDSATNHIALGSEMKQGKSENSKGLGVRFPTRQILVTDN